MTNCNGADQSNLNIAVQLLRYQNIAQADISDAWRPKLIQAFDVEYIVEGRSESCCYPEDDDGERQQSFASDQDQPRLLKDFSDSIVFEIIFRCRQSSIAQR